MSDAPMIVKVKPLVWERYWNGCYTVKSMKDADNGCDVTYYAERAAPSGIIVNTVTKPGYFRCWIDWGKEYETLEAAKSAAQADHAARILAALDLTPDPRVTALVEAAKKMVAAYRDDTDGTIGAFYALDAALSAFKGGADG